MANSRSSAVRSRRYYRALDLGFVPPPSGAGWNRPSVAPPSDFYDVESRNHYDIGLSVGRYPVPLPPWGHRGIYPSTAPRIGLWADMEDSDEEVLHVDAASMPVLETVPPAAVVVFSLSVSGTHYSDISVPLRPGCDTIQRGNCITGPPAAEQYKGNISDIPAVILYVICVMPFLLFFMSGCGLL